jgi:hypothetical protein
VPWIIDSLVFIVVVYQRVGVANQREIDHWGDQGVDGRIILIWIFRNCEGVN